LQNSVNDGKVCSVSKVNCGGKIVKKSKRTLHMQDVQLIHNDIVFMKFKTYIPDNNDIIDDFLHIFYYLIVCYSKRCFRYNGNWKSHHKLFQLNIPVNFDYELSNKTSTHSKLLYIQKQMFKYRLEYEAFSNISEKLLFTPAYCSKFITFINDSLILFVNEIIKPIKHISPTIMHLILKYNNLETIQNTSKKSMLINYDALKQFTSANQIVV